MSEEKPIKDIQGVEIPEDIMNDILNSGLIICAMKYHGKSDALKFLFRQCMRRNDIRVLIFDPCQNFRHKFDSIPFIEMNDFSLPLHNEKDLLFDVELLNPLNRKIAIGQLALEDYQMRRETKKQLDGDLPYWVIYGIEEGHNILGRFSLSGDIGKTWMTLYSEGRNFKMSFFFTTQRLADMDASVIERCRGYLIGALNGDNDLAKIKRVAGKEVAIQSKMLKQGQWIYWNGNKKEAYRIDFPQFKQEGKPFLMKKNGEFQIRQLSLP